MQPDPKLLNDLARRLAESLPAPLAQMKQDLEKNFRAVLEGALSRLDLVTREEFDAQAAVLARTREKLDKLEADVAQLEESKKS